MASTRQQILEAVRTRLLAIAVASGFVTDAGQAVSVNELPELGPDDPNEAIAVLIGDDIFEFQQAGQVFGILLPVEIQALAKVSLDEPWARIEAVLGDIKKAFELADRTLGGLVSSPMERGVTKNAPREPGSTTAGVGITYNVRYREAWGRP